MQCIDTAVMFNQLTSNLEPGSKTLMGTLCDFRTNCTVDALKGPKHETFESGFFISYRRPVWVGDLEHGERNKFLDDWGRYSSFCILSTC